MNGSGPAAEAAVPARRRPGHAFRRDIEGLRGLAILLVVAYHAGVPGFTGGYIGVDVFFVLSGYLITGLLIKEIATTGRLDFTNFYARRARRLLPAACTVIVVTLLVGRFIYPPVDHARLANTGLATALYVSNLHFTRSAIDYLADPGADPLLHTWSLAVEEQFYVFWPAMVLLAFAGLRSRIRQGRLAATMIGLAISSYALCIWLTGVTQPFAFFLLPTRAWEFAIGALACMMPLRSPHGGAGLSTVVPASPITGEAGAGGTQRASSSGWPPRHQTGPSVILHAAAWIGCIAVLAAGMRFGAGTVFPGAAAMIPVAGTGIMLAAGAANENAGPLRLMTNRPMQWIGRLSYGWYLWHWPVLIYAHVFPSLRGVMPGVVLSIGSLGLAQLTHVLIENPIRFHKRLVKRPRLSLGVAALLTLIGVATSLATRIIGNRQAASPGQAVYSEARDLPGIYADGCHLSPADTRIARCEYGDTTAASSIVLFGDSHAAQWFPALESIARSRHLRLISLTKSGCPAASVRLQNVQLGREYTECTAWREAAIRRIIAQRPLVVVLSNYAGYIALPGVTERWTASAEDWRTGVERTVATFDSAGIRTILLADTPVPGFDVPSCLARATWNPRIYGNRCDFRRSWEGAVIANRIDADVARTSTGARVVDLTDLICQTDPCRPAADGFVRFRDAHHLTTRFAASLAPVLAERILRGENTEGRSDQEGAEYRAR